MKSSAHLYPINDRARFLAGYVEPDARDGRTARLSIGAIDSEPKAPAKVDPLHRSRERTA